MNWLALEFAYDYRSVALQYRGQIFEEFQDGGRHTPAVGMIHRALQSAGARPGEIDRLVVGLGPGSYTGVRLAISVAQGWQLATGVECVGWSSFEGLARTGSRSGLTQATLAVDAQRDEAAVTRVEWAGDGTHRVGETQLVGWEELRQQAAGGEMMLGPGLPGRWGIGRELRSSAADLLASLPEQPTITPAEALAPVYLRMAQFVKAPPPRNWTGMNASSPTVTVL